MKRIFKSIVSEWKHTAWKKREEARFEAEQKKLDDELGWIYIS